jgi:hypothetical protein
MVNLAEANKLATQLLTSAVNAKSVGLTSTSEIAERSASMMMAMVSTIETLREENSQLRVMLDRCRPEEGVVRG